MQKRKKMLSLCWEYTVYPILFQLQNDASSCDILTSAVDRYYIRTFPRRRKTAVFDSAHPWSERLGEDASFRGTIDRLEVVMRNPRGCEGYPHMDMDEQCKRYIE